MNAHTYELIRLLQKNVRNECYKAKRDPKDIHIAAILYPSVTDSSHTTLVYLKLI